MTREEAKELFKKSYDFSVNYYDHTEVVSLNQVDIILNKIFEEHEKEIALLKQCIEEAIKRPMGVEPSVYSDYKSSHS